MWLKTDEEMLNLVHAQRIEVADGGLYVVWPSGRTFVPCDDPEEELQRLFYALRRRTLAYEVGVRGAKLGGTDY